MENEHAIDRDVFRHNNDPILNRFSILFTKKVNINPMYHAVFCMLQQGVDEHQIIEELLQNNEELKNTLVRLTEQNNKYYKNGI